MSNGVTLPLLSSGVSVITHNVQRVSRVSSHGSRSSLSARARFRFEIVSRGPAEGPTCSSFPGIPRSIRRGRLSGRRRDGLGEGTVIGTVSERNGNDH